MNDERTEGAQEINLSVRKIEQSVERRKGRDGGGGIIFLASSRVSPETFFALREVHSTRYWV